MKIEDIPGNEWMKDWGWEWKAPDYVEGSHPMDTGDVTWHHVWPAAPTAEGLDSQ